MAGITLADAQARLQAHSDAEAKVLKGQRVELDGKRLTRADRESIRRSIETWNARVHEFSARVAGRERPRTIVPGFQPG